MSCTAENSQFVMKNVNDFFFFFFFFFRFWLHVETVGNDFLNLNWNLNRKSQYLHYEPCKSGNTGVSDCALDIREGRVVRRCVRFRPVRMPVDNTFCPQYFSLVPGVVSGYLVRIYSLKCML